MEYPERAVSRVCNPVHGLASTEEFFPSLAKLKKACDEAAAEAAERDRWARRAAQPKEILPPPDPFAGCYTGPIEQIKPGDILHHTRFPEYDAYMQTKGMAKARYWGVNETWIDSGQRPFQIAAKPEANPFEQADHHPPTLPPEPSRPE